MALLSPLRKLLRSAQPSVDELQRELDRFDARLDKARQALRVANDGRGDAWLDGESAVQANRAAATQAAEEIADMEAVRPLLVQRLEERRLAEADAARVRRYEAAQSTAARSRDALIDRLPKHIAEHLALIRLIEEARAEIEAANSDLPPGSPPIADPETVIRDLPSLDREVLSESRSVVWVRTDRYPAEPFDPASVHAFEDFGAGRGQFREKAKGVDVVVPCIGRVQVTREVAVFERAESATRLRDVAMPGFRYFDAGYRPCQWPSATPDEVLRVVAKAEEDRVPPRRERFIRTEKDSEELPAIIGSPPSVGVSLSRAGHDPARPRSPGRGRVSSYVDPNQQRTEGVEV